MARNYRFPDLETYGSQPGNQRLPFFFAPVRVRNYGPCRTWASHIDSMWKNLLKPPHTKTVQKDRFVKATLVARLLRANFCSEETGAGKSYLNDHPTV